MSTLALARRSVTESPAFGVYLLAIAVLPFRWLSPLEHFYSNSQLTDVLAALATALWLLERIRDRDLQRAFRTWQIPLALHLALSCVSMAFAEPGFGGSWKTVLLMTELAVLAVITADFAAEPSRRRLIMRVIVASALVTVVLGAIALVLFYAGVSSGLVGNYGEQLEPSDLYTRVQAGFDSPPLLASFCIFASGVAASKDAGLSTRLRIPTQISLALLCLATVSRAFLGFLFAVLLRWSAELQGRPRILVPVAGAVICVGILAALTVGRLHLNPVEPFSISYVVPDPGNRREAFETSLTTLGDHPLLGVGPGALPGLNRGLPFRAHFTPLNVAAPRFPGPARSQRHVLVALAIAPTPHGYCSLERVCRDCDRWASGRRRSLSPHLDPDRPTQRRRADVARQSERLGFGEQCPGLSRSDEPTKAGTGARNAADGRRRPRDRPVGDDPLTQGKTLREVVLLPPMRN